MTADATTADLAERAKAEDLVFECELEAPPAKVWRALTVPDYLAAWLAPMKPESLRFDGKAAGLAGQVEFSISAADPPHRLRCAWREEDGASTLDSVVTFELAPMRNGGTRLRITHGDFVLKPAAANRNEPMTMLRAA